MEDVQIGDEVLVSGGEFSRVYAIEHRDSKSVTKMISIELVDGSQTRSN